MWSHVLDTVLPQLFYQGQGINGQKPQDGEGTPHSPYMVVFLILRLTAVAAHSSAGSLTLGPARGVEPIRIDWDEWSKDFTAHYI